MHPDPKNRIHTPPEPPPSAQFPEDPLKPNQAQSRPVLKYVIFLLLNLPNLRPPPVRLLQRRQTLHRRSPGPPARHAGSSRTTSSSAKSSLARTCSPISAPLPGTGTRLLNLTVKFLPVKNVAPWKCHKNSSNFSAFIVNVACGTLIPPSAHKHFFRQNDQ